MLGVEVSVRQNKLFRLDTAKVLGHRRDGIKVREEAKEVAMKTIRNTLKIYFILRHLRVFDTLNIVKPASPEVPRLRHSSVRLLPSK